MSVKRRQFMIAAGAALSTPRLASGASPPTTWRMITSWPRNLPGPGVTAQRLADRITALSGGELTIKLYGAGEVVPALEVFDAVAEGVAELGHTASFFWQGKMSASVFFTAVPFGLTADEHAAWIYHGGGQALWDALYADLGVSPFMAGNTGMGMGGWFKRELAGVESLKGLKYRIPGLGGEILRRLGAVPVTLAPGDIFPALQTGVVDGAEFVGPWSDMAFGFYKVAPYYYWPGFHEPNGSAECLVNNEKFAALDPMLREVIINACQAENAYSVAEANWQNAQALDTLIAKYDVKIRRFSDEILTATRDIAAEVLDEFANRDAMSRQIYESYSAARTQAMAWSHVSSSAFLNARAGAAACG